MKPILTIIFLIAAQFGEAQQYSTPVIKTYIGSWKDTIKLKRVTADLGVILQIDSLSGDIFAVVDTNIWQRKSSGGGLSISSTPPNTPIFKGTIKFGCGTISNTRLDTVWQAPKKRKPRIK